MKQPMGQAKKWEPSMNNRRRQAHQHHALDHMSEGISEVSPKTNTFSSMTHEGFMRTIKS